MQSAHNGSLRSYRETQIKTASQGTLIVMLYDEAMKRIKRALELFADAETDNPAPGDIEQIGRLLVKAQDIITELMVALDFERGGDIARNLFSFYMFVNRQLMEANMKKQSAPIANVAEMLAELRDAWSTVVARGDTPDAASPPGGGVNIAG